MPDQVRHDGQKISDFLNYDTASKAGIQSFFNALYYWMPYQVCHDRQNINNFLKCDTVWKAGIQNSDYLHRT
jgi:hypothetical protein